MALFAKLGGRLQRLAGELLRDGGLARRGRESERRADGELHDQKQRSIARTRVNSALQGARVGASRRRLLDIENRLRMLKSR
jgi:hypothetical protein